LDQQAPVAKISFPKNQKLFPPHPFICISKEYLISMQNLAEGNQLHALPLLLLQNSEKEITIESWIEGDVLHRKRYLFPKDNDFIEISFRDLYIFDIYKVKITLDGFVKTKIAENVVIAKDVFASRRDVCLHNNRVTFAYQAPNQTKIFSYDMLSGEPSELLTIPYDDSYRSCFLNAETNTYYLMESQMFDLATLTYGRV